MVILTLMITASAGPGSFAVRKLHVCCRLAIRKQFPDTPSGNLRRESTSHRGWVKMAQMFTTSFSVTLRIKHYFDFAAYVHPKFRTSFSNESRSIDIWNMQTESSQSKGAGNAATSSHANDLSAVHR